MSSIVFVQREIEDKLGPMLLTAYARSKGHQAGMLVDPVRNLARLKEMKPTFIGLSVLSPSVNWALNTARFLKNHLPKSLIVMGGPHPTFYPEVIQEEAIDVVCQGEGERPLGLLLERYDGSMESLREIPNVWIKEGGEIKKNELSALLTAEELSELPPCDRSLYAEFALLRRNPHKKIWTSRGCPYNCSYCFNQTYKKMYQGKGTMIRRRSVESVIGEIKELKKYGWRTLEIVDDQFLLSSEWTTEFCRRFKREVGGNFSCASSARQITSGMVRELKEAGCVAICFAIESGVERIRRGVYNKAISDEDIVQAAEVLHKHKLPFLAFNMVGLPDESMEDIYQTIEINQRIKTTYPWCSIVQAYPGTEVRRHFGLSQSIGEDEQFTYSCFQESMLPDPEKRRIAFNTQKLFAHMVKSGTSFKGFKRLVTAMPRPVEKIYPLSFYWHYGNSIRDRYGLSWMALARYWWYSQG